MGFQAGGGRIGASTSPTSTTGGFQAGGHVRTASSTTSGSTAGPTRTQTAPPSINVGTTYTGSQSVSVGAVQPTTRPSFAYRGSFGSYGHTATTPSLRAGPTSVWFTQFGYTAKTYPFPPNRHRPFHVTRVIEPQFNHTASAASWWTPRQVPGQTRTTNGYLY